MRLALLACLFCAPFVQAQLLSEAVRKFPAETNSLEYDNLKQLRRLPNYADLRRQYSSQSLARVQTALLTLGVPEVKLSEVVTASGPRGFFGLLAGRFELAAITVEAANHGFSRNALGEGSVFCSREDVCFFFSPSEEGHAEFATRAQIAAMSNVTLGYAPSIRSNGPLMAVLNRLDPDAPVSGAAPGTQITQFIGDSIPQGLASKLDLPKLFANIEMFGYSIRMDSKAHVAVDVTCKSGMDSKLLSDTLNAASGLERMAALVGNSVPFENMTATSEGRMVTLKLDAPITP